MHHHATASADAHKPLARPPLRLTTGVLVAAAVVLATLAVIGNYAYEILTLVDIPLGRGTLPTVVNDGAEERSGAIDWGIVGRGASVGDAPAVREDRGNSPFAAPVPKSTDVFGNAAPAPAAISGATVTPSPGAGGAGETAARAQPGKPPCTEGAAGRGPCK